MKIEDRVLAKLEGKYRPHHEWSLVLHRCPKCGDDKWRTHVNPRKGITHCKRNGCVTQLSEILDDYDFTPAPSVQQEPTVPEHWAVYLPDLWACAKRDWSSLAGLRCLRYWKKRGLPLEEVDQGRVCYFDEGPLADRVCLLVYERDEPVFVMGRTLRNRIPKILYAPSVLTGHGKSEVLFGLDKIKEGDEVYLSEGAMSSLSGPNGVAFLGSTLSYVQAEKLSEKKPRCVYYLVEDGIKDSTILDTAQKLHSYDIPTYIYFLQGGDLNDNPGQFSSIRRNAYPFQPLLTPAILSRLRTASVVQESSPPLQRKLGFFSLTHSFA